MPILVTHFLGFYADANFGGLVPVLKVVPIFVSEACFVSGLQSFSFGALTISLKAFSI